MRTYIDPSVELVDSSNSNVWFWEWLKSRATIVKNQDDIDLDVSKLSCINNLPEYIKVGDEVVNTEEYKKRIMRMNLQYMNSYVLTFDLHCSALFRDLLFNINNSGQWSTSNRFLFSLYGPESVFDESMYHISSEYKDIPEWEDQFTKYMKAIKEDQVVDHNRRQMPYSISSASMWTANYRTVISMISFLKHHVPFLYEVYGKQFMRELNINESYLSVDDSPALTQYILRDRSNWEEGTRYVNGHVTVNTYMGLILYSQFIRQTDTCISGFYNLLMHDDPEEFKHKVFKGDTKMAIQCSASYDKIKRTVQNRLCAFAMSSGTDYCSWTYFLTRFMDKDLSLEQFMELLPCKFKDNKVVDCKFYDDIKFRNEGKELSNCPCPLFSMSMKDAQFKKNRDQNIIGDKYYELTRHLAFNGLDHKYETKLWTSDLIIRTKVELIDEIKKKIAFHANLIEEQWKSESPNYRTFSLSKYSQYAVGNDYTCMLKGYLIDYIRLLLDGEFYDSYVIDFGGDVYVQNLNNRMIQIENSKFNIHIDSGKYSIFTSGNTNKRGNHIIGSRRNSYCTIVKKWQSDEVVDNILCDIFATKAYAGEQCMINLIRQLNGVQSLYFTEGGDLINTTYCASPFFNKVQVEIRDNMLSKLTSAFRPDKTESSLRYDQGDDTAVDEVVLDNVRGIDESTCLCFPMNTKDLGTLFEVGHAIAKNKILIAYDEKKDSYYINMGIENRNVYTHGDNYLFDCSKKRDVIAMGYLYSKLPRANISYELNGSPDNIMLSVNFNHIEKVDGKYKLIKRNESDRDR